MNNQNSKELVGFLNEIILISNEIINIKINNITNNDSDDMFFVNHFYKRINAFCKSVILLINNNYNHEAVIIARNILELYFYFFSYMKDKTLAKKWRIYAFVEDYKKAESIESGKGNLLFEQYKEMYGEELINAVLNEYDLNKKQKWHKKGSIKDLIINDPKAAFGRNQIEKYGVHPILW